VLRCFYISRAVERRPHSLKLPDSSRSVTMALWCLGSPHLPPRSRLAGASAGHHLPGSEPRLQELRHNSTPPRALPVLRRGKRRMPAGLEPSAAPGRRRRRCLLQSWARCRGAEPVDEDRSKQRRDNVGIWHRTRYVASKGFAFSVSESFLGCAHVW
jgi:hypothetical protein